MLPPTITNHIPVVQPVVNFLSQGIFLCLLCLGLVMYANEVETKKN